MPESANVCSLQDLRNYVERMICKIHELEPQVFQMTERVLVRKGRPCGICFCLHGPRSVKFVAIWETDQNTVLLYGSSGERVGRVRLTGRPTLQQATA